LVVLRFFVPMGTGVPNKFADSIWTNGLAWVRPASPWTPKERVPLNAIGTLMSNLSSDGSLPKGSGLSLRVWATNAQFNLSRNFIALSQWIG
jgi:hypothetical protein